MVNGVSGRAEEVETDSVEEQQATEFGRSQKVFGKKADRKKKVSIFSEPKTMVQVRIFQKKSEKYLM